jgi:hypothetical protein
MAGGIVVIGAAPSMLAAHTFYTISSRMENNTTTPNLVGAGGFAGAAAGSVGGVAAVSASGTTAGLSAAGVTSGLSSLGGGTVAAGGAGMLGGLAVVATGAVAVAAAGAGTAYLVSKPIVQSRLIENHAWLIEMALAHGFRRMDLPTQGYAPGDRVVLSGLNTTSLNGIAGVLTEFDMGSGRWSVALPDGVKAIKPDNLSVARSVNAESGVRAQRVSSQRAANAVTVAEALSIFKAIGVGQGYRGIPPHDELYVGPFYIIFRSNLRGAPKACNASDGLVCEFKVTDLRHAAEQYKPKHNSTTHAYGICDSRGYVIYYNAEFTSSFERHTGVANCKEAIRKKYG